MTIRTLHLINSLGAGGAERSLAELLPDLPARGFEPHVAVFHHRVEGVEHDVAAAGVPIHHVGRTGWGGRIQEVRRLIVELRPDLVHTTIFEADVVGRIAAWRERRPVLTSLVNTSYAPIRLTDPNIARVRLRGAQAIDASTARLGTVRFHAITQVVKDAAVRDLRVRPELITVVHRGRRRERLGESTPERRRAVRDRLGIPQDAPVVLHVGREEHQKGHDILFDALGPLFEDDPSLHLVLAGRRGNTTPVIDTRIVDLPADRVHRLGYVDEVPDLLAAADVFAFPSRYEGLGGAALEAMAMQTPIVATDLPALRECLNGVARFVPVERSGAFREAIRATLTDLAAARTAARHGRERFEMHFGHEITVSLMAHLLERSASSGT